MNTRPTVLFADDHPIFREGLLKVVERARRFDVVGQAMNGSEALEKIRSLHPDIAVLDVEMPMMNGIDVARAVYKEALPTDVVFLTMFKDSHYFNAALDLGVRGYVLKDSVSGELLDCLTAISEGQYYISPSISHLLVEWRNRSIESSTSVPSIRHLTPAERAIVRLLAENLTSKEIAERLSVSTRTVENHRLRICQKLEIKGHHKLLQFALEHRSEL